MAPASYSASAPGSLMLLGEHAVLHGRRALVCAVNRRIHVSLVPRADSTVNISSSLGNWSGEVSQLIPTEPFLFVTAALGRLREEFSSGFDLRIESEFSHKVGLGSSAAVTAATIGAANRWTRGRIDRADILNEGIGVIRQVQGLGSGADVAASVYGGLVAYRSQPRELRKIDGVFPLTVVYSGSKKPTAEVVRMVEDMRRKHPTACQSIYDIMDGSAVEAEAAIGCKDWKRFGELLNINQGLMDALGVSNAALSEIVHMLRNDAGILGAKISGSGLGDCAVGLGRAERGDWPYDVLPVEMEPNGMVVSPDKE